MGAHIQDANVQTCPMQKHRNPIAGIFYDRKSELIQIQNVFQIGVDTL